jgi:mRNA interferase RelE/StbE
MMRIWASSQVQQWLHSLSPEVKRRVRLALRGLERRQGDIKALEGELEGFYRLRVGGYRIIFSEHAHQVLRLDYADLRDSVYEQFIRLLREK